MSMQVQKPGGITSETFRFVGGALGNFAKALQDMASHKNAIPLALVLSIIFGGIYMLMRGGVEWGWHVVIILLIIGSIATSNPENDHGNQTENK